MQQRKTTFWRVHSSVGATNRTGEKQTWTCLYISAHRFSPSAKRITFKVPDGDIMATRLSLVRWKGRAGGACLLIRERGRQGDRARCDNCSQLEEKTRRRRRRMCVCDIVAGLYWISETLQRLFTLFSFLFSFSSFSLVLFHLLLVLLYLFFQPIPLLSSSAFLVLFMLFFSFSLFLRDPEWKVSTTVNETNSRSLQF